MSNYIKKVAVFCGSSLGNDESIREQSRLIGHGLGKGGYDLIYGGGTTGLMGIVAEAALAAGSKVKGIVPHIFRGANGKEQGYLKGSEEVLVEGMAARKEQMITEADAAIILPGALGSLDEIYEMAVAQQLKTYSDPDAKIQPVIVLNYDGYYDGQIASLDKMIEKGFLDPNFREFITFVDTAEEAISLLNEYNDREPYVASQFKSGKTLPKLPKPKM